MKKVRSLVIALALFAAYGGVASAASEGLVTMPISSPVATSGTAEVTGTVVEPAEPMANNGTTLPLDQGVELDTGSDVPVQGDEPVYEESTVDVATPKATTPPVNTTPLTVSSEPVATPKVEKLVKTGDNPYTGSLTYLASIGASVLAIGLLTITSLRRKKKVV